MILIEIKSANFNLHIFSETKERTKSLHTPRGSRSQFDDVYEDDDGNVYCDYGECRLKWKRTHRNTSASLRLRKFAASPESISKKVSGNGVNLKVDVIKVNK